MATVDRFEDLEVWKRARELANTIYDISEVGTFGRYHGLKEQMHRAAISILSNIVEGFESRTQACHLCHSEPLVIGGEETTQTMKRSFAAKKRRLRMTGNYSQALSSKLGGAYFKQIARLIQYLETQPNSRRIREDGAFYDVETRTF
jgi:hypothetical protein